MNSLRSLHRALALFLCTAVPAPGAVLTWTNIAGGNWSASTNWSPNQVPIAADQIFITNAGTYSVTVSANTTVNRLSLGGGTGIQTLQQSDGIVSPGSATILANGQWRIQSGAIGGVLIIESNASFLVEGTAAKTLSAIVTNRGTMQLGGTGDLNLTGSLDNEGLFNLDGSVSLLTTYLQPRPLRNSGTIRKTSGTGTANLGVASYYGVSLTNTGTIEAQAGVISCFGGGLLDGTLKTAAGTRLDFVGGTCTHSGSGSPIVTGTGTTRMTSGTFLLHDYPPGFLFVGGNVQLLPDFQGGTGITNLVLDGATLTGNNTVTGTLRWRDGAIGGVLIIESNASFLVEGTAAKTLSAIVTNRGTMQLGGTGDLNLTGSLDNEGLFNLDGSVSLLTTYLQPRPLRNSGTIRKTSGTGTANLGVASYYGVSLTNTGTIEAQAGVISCFGGGLLDGTLKTAAGTRLDFVGGTCTHSGSGSPIVTGTGTTRMTSGTFLLHDYPPGFLFVGGNVQLLPDFQGGTGITNLVLDGATLTGNNTVTGTLRWRDGAIGGVLIIESNASFLVEGTAAKTLSAIVTNRGTMQLGGTGDLNLTGSLDNEGLFNLDGSVSLLTTYLQPRPLRNSGTIRKTSGTGTANLGVASYYGVSLTNTGTIEAQAGVISCFGGGLLDGTLKTAAGTRLDFVGGTCTHSGSGSPIVTGTGTTRMTSGTFLLHDYPPGFLFVGGNVQLLPDFQGGTGITNLVLDGATLTGNNTVTGTLRWRDGAIGGVLIIESNASFLVEGTAAKTLSAIVTNRGTMQLGGTGDLNLTGSLDNEGLFNLDGSVSLLTTYLQPRPLRNSGTIRKTSGTGTANLGVASYYGVSLTNTGTIEAQAGVISCFGGGLLDGTLKTAAGTRLDFVGGTCTHSGSGSPIVTGAGTTRMTSGTFLLHDYPPGFLFVGGNVQLLPDFQGGAGITNLVLDGTTLTGNNTVTGTLRWRDGAIGGVLIIESNASFLVEGTAAKTLSAIVTNRGTMQLGGTGDLNLTGSLDNEGLFNLDGSVSLLTTYLQPRPLRNSGTIRKTSGTGTANLGVASYYGVSLTNTGTIEAQAGVISCFGGGLLDGTLKTAAGTRLDFVGGTCTHSGSGSPIVTGAGTTRMTSGTFLLHDYPPGFLFVGGNVQLLPDFQGGAGITNLVLDGTTLTGNNTVTGTLRWRDGAIGGVLIIESNASFLVEGTAAKTLSAIVTNRGTMQLGGTGDLNLTGSLDNEGLFNLDGSVSLLTTYLQPRPLRNSGTIRKTSGTGTANLGVASYYGVSLTNTGTIEAQAGVISCFGANDLSGGTLQAAIRSLSNFGRIHFATPPVLTGTLSAYLANNYAPALNNRFSIITFPSRNGAFTDTSLPTDYIWQTTYNAADVSITVLRTALAAYWPANTNATEVVNNRTATPTGGASYTNGIVGDAFYFNGNGCFTAPDGPEFRFGTNSFTIEFWIWPDSYTGSVPAEGIRVLQKPAASNSLLAVDLVDSGRIEAEILDDSSQPGSTTSSGRVSVGSWNHVAIVIDRVSREARYFINGGLDSVLPLPATFTGTLDLTNAPIEIGSCNWNPFRGRLDELRFYTKALTAADVAVRVQGTIGCTNCPAPAPVLSPAVASVVTGLSQSFAVAGGAGPFNFSFATNNSGATIGSLNGIYTAGTTVNTIDTIRVTDSRGLSGSARVNVLPAATPRPDLIVHRVTAPANATPGIPFPVVWTLTNSGPGSAFAPWQDFVLLSADAAIGNDTLLGAFTITNNLVAGGSITVTQHVTIPIEGASGNLRVVVATDANSAVIELSNTNNSAITATPTVIPQTLTLSLNLVELREDAPNPIVNGALRRNGSLASSLIVNLASSAPGELTAPATVTIPVGQSSTTFSVQVVPDGVFDGQKTVNVTAVAAGYAGGSTTFTVLDANIPSLGIRFGLTEITEGDPFNIILTRPAAASSTTLTATLNASSPAQFLTPPTTTFSIGQTSVVVAVLSINDSLIERSNSHTFTVQAPGFNPAAAAIPVLDNDLPVVTLTLGANTVSEGAGANATFGVLTRAPAANESLTLTLTSGDTNIARVPASVVIPAGQASITFPIAVTDNNTADGAHLVALGGSIREPGTGLIVGEVIPVVLTVTDNDGPTLTVALESDAVGEGLNPATVGTVTRNSSVNTALAVTLASSRTNEAIVPLTIEIPIGATSINFPVTSLTDGTNDGSQSVTITASAPGFTTGSAPLVVTDADFVDLVVSSVRFNTNAATAESIDVIYRIENRGTREASGSWSQRVFFSSDALVGDDTLAAQNDFTGALGAGQFFEQSVRVKLPNQVGRTWVVVQTDHANSLAELLEGNNLVLAPDPITVAPAYSVSVAADVEVAPGGTPVHFTGVALRPDLEPANNEVVKVCLELRGTKRFYQAVTDINGGYSITFVPLPGEGGHYRLAAGHPGDSVLLPQDEFTLLALRAGNPGRLTLLEGESASSTVTIQNLADVPQFGLTATLVSGPTNITIQPNLSANTVAGDGSVTLAYAVTAPNGISGSSSFRIRIASAEGAVTDVNVPVTIEAKRARLVAFPGSLESGMKRGAQRIVEFAITNVGGLPTGPLQLLTPNVSWLSLASGGSMPPLAPGEGAKISVQLTPPDDLPLGPHSGTIAINSSNAVLSVPYTFRSLSDAIGALRVMSVDEFTYYAEGAPKVSNAVVKITDAITGTVLNTNTGPTGELLLPALVESYYYIDVTAEKHSSFRDLVRIEPGATNLVTALMARQSVTYTWTVVPIQIEDRYTITVETIFETAVPKPVVTIEPNIIDLANFVGTEQQINLTLRNHGLIAAQNTKLSFPTHSRWSFTPLIGDVGVLPAQSTLVIPLTIRKLNLAGASGGLISAAGGGESCNLPANLEWDTPCGDTAIHNSVNIGLLSLIPFCGLAAGYEPGSFNSSIWDGIGGGGSGGGGTTELRAKDYGDPIFRDVPYKCDPCEQARFNWVVLHCLWKLIPGSDLYDLAGETVGGASGAASGEPVIQAAGGVSGLKQCLKKEVDALSDDCIDAAGAALEGDAKSAVSSAGDCFAIPKCLPGGGTLMWAIECEMELMELPECKGRGLGGLGSASAGTFTAASDGGVTFINPVIPPFDSAAPLLLSALRAHKTLRPAQYFFGDRAWLDATNDLAANARWTTNLQAALKTNSPAGVNIDASERLTLLSGDLPVPLATAIRFIERINRTLDYAARSITTVAQVPEGESRDFIAMDEFSHLIDEARIAKAAIQAEGFDNPADYFINANVEYLNRLSQSGGGAVCARVKVRLDQEAVLTRDAFNARLEISNDTEAALSEFSVDLRVRDEQGRETTSLFQLRAPELTGIGAIDGTGVVPAQSTARASWVLVPTSEAAPFGTVRHFVSGTMRYRQNDVLVSLPLADAPIDVLPNPKLVVKYFHERDVFSDDPFTPELEPAIPYSLAVMVANEGYGTARQMRISSAQPQIVENDKGLLIDFEILGSQVENQPGSPSLTVNLGDIGPGTNAIARWLFRSSLQGLFIDYSATFEHIDGLGDKRLSLIDRVEIHEMMHIVSADRSFEDGRPDFLVNDIPDFDDYPDTLHLSSGGTEHVVVYTEGTPSNLVTPYQPTATLIVPSSPGWAYFRLPDPANGSTRLVSVRRANNTEVPLENFWITDRTFIGLGLPARREFRLHLLDYQPSGAYTLTYESASASTDLISPVSRVNALPANSSADFAVTWNGSDVGRGIAAFDLFVSENNGAFTRTMTATPLKGLVFRGQPGVRYGFYTVAIDAAGNREPAPGTPDAETLVSISNRPPALVLPASATIDEGDTLALEAVGSDPDAPAQALTYQIISAPAGLTLNPNNGTISWVTGEGNGPSTNSVSVRVSDNGVPSLSATASVTVIVAEVNQPPALDPVASRIINKGVTVTIPFAARDSDLPANHLTFSLSSGAPAGATINPTNGVFTWRPGNDIPAGTNRITVSVSDNATPPRIATQALTLIVRNRSADFTVSVGSTNVFGGESNGVPVRLTTGVELRDLAVVLNRPGGRLDNLALGTFAPEVTSALLEPVSSNASRLRFQFAGLLSASNHALADLRFSTSTNGPSTIISLTPTNAVATDYAGVTLNRAGSASGIVVIVNREPVLLGRMDPGRTLRLYGRPGINYAIESKPGLTLPAPWEEWTKFTLLDRFRDIDVGTSAPFAVFRALETGAGISLNTQRQSGPVFLTVSGQPGPGYRLEAATTMFPIANWQTLTTFTLSNDNQVLNLPPTNLPIRFFRIVKP